MVTITESAQEYLAELLSKQDDALGVRVFINQPGTSRAETCIAYCREGDVDEADETHKYPAFMAYFEFRSLPFLDAFCKRLHIPTVRVPLTEERRRRGVLVPWSRLR